MDDEQYRGRPESSQQLLGDDDPDLGKLLINYFANSQLGGSKNRQTSESTQPRHSRPNRRKAIRHALTT